MMMHQSLVLNFLVKKQTWKEERKSEEKQTQTTREIKKKKWIFFFKNLHLQLSLGHPL